MKKQIKKVMYVFFSILISILTILILFIYNISIKKYEIKNVKLVVNKGEKVNRIYTNLGVDYNIFDRLLFKFTDKVDYIKAGNFNFDGEYTKIEILDVLKSPKFNNIILTIPEGFTSEQVLERIESLGLASVSQMKEAMKKYNFYYPHNEVFEGYLFPQTYYFEGSEKAFEILDKILNQFIFHFNPLDYPDKKDFYEKLIVASIIEKEAGIDSDKEILASIIYNRLKINMKIQSDATLRYTLKRKVYRKDLQTDKSLYNTYMYTGLTPSPISNPSLSSIKASFNPKKTDYYYFFMKDGKTYYSKTNDEHIKKRIESGY